MLEALKAEVCELNRALPASGLVALTWGNVSGIDRASGLVAIKPSGVGYGELTPDSVVLVDLDGRAVEGDLNPSSDTRTHVALYRAWPGIGGVCHTHSPAATAFAQAGRAIPCLGTTHADHFYGEVTVCRALTPDEVAGDYEALTGRAITDHFAAAGIDPLAIPAVLQHRHAPFTWGPTPANALENSIALEFCARMAIDTLRLAPDTAHLPAHLLDKHFLRKHGENAYYGQGATAADRSPEPPA
jgi:L-ribulose-5-phosphate 4-epimerase